VILLLLAEMLTVGGVKLLVEGSYPADDDGYTFQAFDISDECNKSHRTLVFTLSDGVSYLKCFVSPQLHHVFFGDLCTKNSFIKVGRFASINADDGVRVNLLDISVHSRECHIIGEPSAWQHGNKRRSEEDPDGVANVKQKTLIYNNNNESDEIVGVRLWVVMTARIKKGFVINAARTLVIG
jgi:hypothetical protein